MEFDVDSWRELPVYSGVASDYLTEDSGNPWLSLGVMDSIRDEPLLQAWDHYLGIQTEMLVDQEMTWLRARGFAQNARGVLEVGSANGDYGAHLAREFPDVRIYGVEANPCLADRYDPLAETGQNYSIDICKVGEQELPKEISGNFTHCILRYVLQHVSDPARVVSALYDALPVGGRIFIIEEDETYLRAQPNWPAYEGAVDIWRRVLAAGGTDNAIGGKLPGILAGVGFDVDAFEIKLRNNVEVGDTFLAYFAAASRVLHLTNPSLVTERELQKVISEFEASEAEHRKRYVATYPQFLLSAYKAAP
ncbi:class I SAM-dependent methyltransferase [Streptomyces sp. NPDC053431]|uniref:class I SAM-dependent methyltransferase n=1 Tax=Streptomyces sp. NPDC053431 TaxID=3365703 RepID=UPI0037D86C73